MFLYESYFVSLGLWFPHPDLLVLYCISKNMVITQLTAPSIRNLIAVLVMGAECKIKVDLPFFESMTHISRNQTLLGTFYLSFRAGYKVLTELPSKTRNWELGYFFVRADEHSVSDLYQGLSSD